MEDLVISVRETEKKRELYASERKTALSVFEGNRIVHKEKSENQQTVSVEED